MKRLLAVAAVIGLVFAVSAQSAKAEPSVGNVVYQLTSYYSSVSGFGLLAGDSLVLNYDTDAQDNLGTSNIQYKSANDYFAWRPSGGGGSSASDYASSGSPTSTTSATEIRPSALFGALKGKFFKLAALAGFGGNTEMGFYDAGGTTLLYPTGTTNWLSMLSKGTQPDYDNLFGAEMTLAKPWGLYVNDSTTGQKFTWYLEDSKNTNDEQHARVFKWDDPYDTNTYYVVGFEDLALQNSDKDFNDAVVMFKVTGAIPEPAYVQLSVLVGLAGLGALRARRRNRA